MSRARTIRTKPPITIMATTFRAATLEFLATLLLVFTGCGATVAATTASGEPALQIALAWGFAYATLLQLFSGVLGVHMNPAVSLAFFVTRKLSVREFFERLAIQVVGAITGAAILDSVSGQRRLGSLGVNKIGNISSGAAFGMEFVITFIVVLALFALMEPAFHFPGATHVSTLHYGAVIALVHLIALPFTGCSINPARSFGPAVVTGEWADHWVFWIGPLGGGALGGLLYALWCGSDTARMSMKELLAGSTSEQSPTSASTTTAAALTA
eukprot:m.233561 g.233561  ORF g.233561 m.233561 type:complete len:271 (-) comp19206_c0_seq1:26-838(-)